MGSHQHANGEVSKCTVYSFVILPLLFSLSNSLSLFFSLSLSLSLSLALSTSPFPLPFSFCLPIGEPPPGMGLSLQPWRTCGQDGKGMLHVYQLCGEKHSGFKLAFDNFYT